MSNANHRGFVSSFLSLLHASQGVDRSPRPIKIRPTPVRQHKPRRSRPVFREREGIKEQQEAKIAACEVKQYRKASKRLACYSRCVFGQPIKHRYFLYQRDDILPF